MKQNSNQFFFPPTINAITGVMDFVSVKPGDTFFLNHNAANILVQEHLHLKSKIEHLELELKKVKRSRAII